MTGSFSMYAVLDSPGINQHKIEYILVYNQKVKVWIICWASPLWTGELKPDNIELLSLCPLGRNIKIWWVAGWSKFSWVWRNQIQKFADGWLHFLWKISIMYYVSSTRVALKLTRIKSIISHLQNTSIEWILIFLAALVAPYKNFSVGGHWSPVIHLEIHTAEQL